MSWQAALDAAREVARRRGGSADIRVWLPACGHGLDAYLTAAALGEVMGQEALRERVQVIGTSESDRELAAARAGRYPVDALDDVPELVRVRYFPEEEGARTFLEELRVGVAFARNDPRRDRLVRQVDLVDARALVADADPAERVGLAERLADSLRPGGLLLLPTDVTIDDDRVPLVAVEGSLGAWERPLPDDATVLGAAWRPREPMRVLVVNEHDLFVRALGLLLDSLFGRFLTVVGVTADADRVLSLVRSTGPDLVVVDVTGAKSAGLPETVRREFPDLPVLALVDDPHEAWRGVLAGGAGGVLPRSASANELVGPLLAVAEGWAVLPPEALRVLARGIAPERYDIIDDLDEDELQLWAWVAEGKQDNEIAEFLFVSARTVKRRIGALLRKLDVSRRVEAAELAGRLGIVARQERLMAQDEVAGV